MDITHLREEYRREALDRKTLRSDPMEQFKFWFGQAQSAQIQEPNAMALATVSAEGKPWNRTVLLKRMDARGLVWCPLVAGSWAWARTPGHYQR